MGAKSFPTWYDHCGRMVLRKNFFCLNFMEHSLRKNNILQTHFTVVSKLMPNLRTFLEVHIASEWCRMEHCQWETALERPHFIKPLANGLPQTRVVPKNGWKPGWAEKPDNEADGVLRVLPTNNHPIYDESRFFHIAELDKFVPAEAWKPSLNLFLFLPSGVFTLTNYFCCLQTFLFSHNIYNP